MRQTASQRVALYCYVDVTKARRIESLGGEVLPCSHPLMEGVGAGPDLDALLIAHLRARAPGAVSEELLRALRSSSPLADAAATPTALEGARVRCARSAAALARHALALARVARV
jgi:hypothetical protein